VSTAVEHHALIPVERIVHTVEGVLTVSPWFDDELVRSPAAQRDDPTQAFSRFKSLSTGEIAAALDSVIDLHVELIAAGWLAGDFYDGCLMYDFASRSIKVIDFECYHRGSYVNEVGALPGSTRFMAPEESTKGATVDERTTVFNMGRMIQVLLIDSNPDHPARELSYAATRLDPALRPETLASFQRTWRSVTSP